MMIDQPPPTNGHHKQPAPLNTPEPAPQPKSKKLASAGMGNTAQPVKPKIGRPEILDAAMKTRIVQGISLGQSIRGSADAEGVSHGTVFTEMKRDPAFATRIKKANGLCERVHLSRVAEGKAGTWQASAWMLERKWAQRWGQKAGKESGGKPSGASMEDVVAKIDEMRKERKHTHITVHTSSDTNGANRVK